MADITILGAYGTKSDKCGSSAFYLNDAHTIDAGNLLIPLQVKSIDIECIWITHSHLDHISDIAYILDNYYEQRTKTLTLRGLKETLDTIKNHFFNNKIWPDFSKIPLQNNSAMSLKYEPIELGQIYHINNHESIEAFPTDHTVPSCGYVITKENRALLISADTYSLDSTIKTVHANKEIHTLVLECSFPSSMIALAKASKHLTPVLLFEQLQSLENKNLKLYINHLKPSYKETLISEINNVKGVWDVTILDDGNKVYF